METKNKNMRKLYILLSVFAFLSMACDSDKDRINFDPDKGQTFLSFEGNTGNLAILINSTGALDITVNSSTRSTSDRLFNVLVTAETTADNAFYDIPATVLIPANEFQGSLAIQGVDPFGVEIEPETIVLSLEASNGAVTGGGFTVNVFIICPVEDGFFTGTYLVEQVTPTILGYDTFDPDGGGVQLELLNNSAFEGDDTIALTETQRIFSAKYIASLGFDNERNYMIDFVCEQVVMASDQVTGLACGGDSVILGPAAIVNGGYQSTDDSVFELIFQDDTTDACGQGSPDVSLRWVKQ